MEIQTIVQKLQNIKTDYPNLTNEEILKLMELHLLQNISNAIRGIK